MTALSGFLVQTRNLVSGKKGPRAAFYIIQPFNSPSSQVNNQERRGRVSRKTQKNIANLAKAQHTQGLIALTKVIALTSYHKLIKI